MLELNSNSRMYWQGKMDSVICEVDGAGQVIREDIDPPVEELVGVKIYN